MSLGQATKPRWDSGLRALLSVAVSVGLLMVVARSLNLDEVVGLFSGSRPIWFGFAALLVPVQIVMGAYRWCHVSNDLSLPMSQRRAVEEYGLSVLLNQVLPGGIAGDAVRVWRHKQGEGSIAAPLRAAVVDRIIGHWAHLGVTLLGLTLWVPIHGTPAPEGAFFLTMGIVVVFAALWRWPPIGLRTLVADTRIALSRPRQFFFHACLSLALVAALLLSFWCCAQGLGVPLGWAAITAAPLLMLVMVIPLSLGGWGLREVSAAIVLSFLGWSSEQAIALSAAYGLVNLIGSLPAAVVLFRSSVSRVTA